VLADDHGLIMEALGHLLDRDYDIVAAVCDGLELVEAAKRLRPDVIVADMNMPRLSGLEALRQLKAERIDSKFVFLTMDGDSALAAEAFRAGGAAYLLKHSATEELHVAIQAVLQGRSYLTPQLAGGVIATLGTCVELRAIGGPGQPCTGGSSKTGK
jgi:DNA-binding NarL/FixJ family response regulator